MNIFSFRVRWTAIFAALVITVMLGACSDDPGPTPAPTNTPMPTATAEATVIPTATPTPTPAATATPTPKFTPVPTATPVPTSEPATTPEPFMAIDSDTTWGEAFEAFDPSERDCIRDAVDEDTLERALDAPIVYEGPTAPDWERPILSCVAPETVRTIIVSLVVAGMEGEGITVGEADRACLTEWAASYDKAFLVDSYDVEDPSDDPAVAEALGRMISCIPTIFAYAFISEAGVGVADRTLSEEEESCLRAWAAGSSAKAQAALITFDPEDPASAEAWGGMIACISDLFVSLMLFSIVDESGLGSTLSAEEEACLEELTEEVVAEVDWAALPSGLEEALEGLGVLLGLGAFGCLPEALSPSTATPAPTPDPTSTIGGSFVYVSAGGDHTCGLQTGGSVVCWGSDEAGQSPPPAGPFKYISAGRGYTCGLKADDSIVCWGGSDLYGRATPPEGSFISVNAGWTHTCGVRSDNSVECWGNDNDGQSTPPGGTFTSVSVGEYYYSCGVKTNGSVVCWGLEFLGSTEAPDGSFASIDTGFAHGCGLKNDDSVECWGFELFDHVAAPDGSFNEVSVGSSHSCGVRIDGSVVCWGDNEDSDGNVFNQSRPLGGPFVSIDAGSFHTCGVRTDGSVACWGDNRSGQSTPPGAETATPAPTATPTPESTDTAAPTPTATPPPTSAVNGSATLDRGALVALYNATDGPDWLDNES